MERSYKAPGGLITVTHIVQKDKIQDISISGDFTFYPKDRLRDIEEALIGVRWDISSIGE